MKRKPKISAIGRREFLAATSGLLAAAVPGGGMIAHASDSEASLRNLRVPKPAGSLRKIPIGVFDPVYDHLSLDAMLDKVSALGLEAMEIGTGGYPNNPHCPLDDLIDDRGKAKAWLKKFEDRGIHEDRKSTRLNSSHSQISYAACCLKKKTRSIVRVLFACPLPTPGISRTIGIGGQVARRSSLRLPLALPSHNRLPATHRSPIEVARS